MSILASNTAGVTWAVSSLLFIKLFQVLFTPPISFHSLLPVLFSTDDLTFPFLETGKRIHLQMDTPSASGSHVLIMHIRWLPFAVRQPSCSVGGRLCTGALRLPPSSVRTYAPGLTSQHLSFAQMSTPEIHAPCWMPACSQVPMFPPQAPAPRRAASAGREAAGWSWRRILARIVRAGALAHVQATAGVLLLSPLTRQEAEIGRWPHRGEQLHKQKKLCSLATCCAPWFLTGLDWSWGVGNPRSVCIFI